MKTYLLLISSLFFFAASAFASENIRVAIADNQKTVTLSSSSGLVLEGMPAGGGERKMLFSATSFGGRIVRVRSKSAFTGVNTGSYRGWVELRKKKNGLLLVINDLDLEDYLKGVIAAEIPPGWEYEVLKAQAVASRTYALYQKRAAGKRPYHILATVNSQVYSGGRGEQAGAMRAVQETAGLVLAYQGEIIPAFYHSSCGGHTENAAELWGLDVPYLQGVDCDCQAISKFGVWEKRVGLSKIAVALRKQGFGINGIADIAIESITPAGHIKDLAVRHSNGVSMVPAETLRAALGYSFLPSVFFEPAVAGNEVVFSGRGLGHGVGLCQWGAKEMAQKGADYKAILFHYYPGTSLMKVSDL